MTGAQCSEQDNWRDPEGNEVAEKSKPPTPQWRSSNNHLADTGRKQFELLATSRAATTVA